MMTGTIREMQLMLPVVFVLADDSQVAHELVVGTGFTGGLSLPTKMIKELGLPYFRRLEAELADGVMNQYLTYLAAIRWHDKLCYFTYPKTRAGHVVTAVLGTNYSGSVVSDFYSGYNCHLGLHQRCWVHLLRNVHTLTQKFPCPVCKSGKATAAIV